MPPRPARTFACALVIAGCGAGLAFAEGNKIVPYAKIADSFLKVKAAAHFDRLLARTILQVPDHSVRPRDVVFTIKAATGPLVVKPAADGTIAWPLTPALQAENPPVEINLPQATHLAIQVDIEARLPDTQHFTYGDVAEVRRQFAAVIKEQAGMLSWFAPVAKGLLLHCGPGCTATIGSGPAAETRQAGKDGTIELPFRDEWLSAGTPVSVSQPSPHIDIKAG